MRINIDLQLRDTPGALLAALEPIADHGGNLVSIIHYHEARVDDGRLIVHVIFDIESKVFLDKIVSDLEQQDIRIAKLDEVFETIVTEVLLIGDIIGNDVRDIIKKIEKADEIRVADVALRMPSDGEGSCAFLKIETRGDMAAQRAHERLAALSQKKNFIAVTGID